MPPDKTGPFLTDPSGREHSLPAQAILGRATECTIVVVHRSVSREHARIRADGRRWRLEDLGSTNGTFLNNERIIVPVQLRDGDRLSIGDVEFVFHDPDTTQRETPLPTLELDLAAGVVRVDRKAVGLSPKEYLLLAYLYERRGQVCSKDEIGRAVWPEYETGGVFDYQIENLVRRLRMRIEADAASPQLLLTVRGLGYKLMAA